MVLISGGTDGGDTKKVTELAELIAPAKPRPRFGGEYSLPIIFAGNRDARAAIERTFSAGSFDLKVVDNLRPTLERENLGPARETIHDVFLEHVMAHAPGYDRLIAWADAPIMPTPGAVGDILQAIARGRGINVVGVDIGGATTDVFSVFDGSFNRTVSANLGMSYSISNVCAEAGMENVLRWVHLDMDERELRRGRHGQRAAVGASGHGRAGTAQPGQEQDDPAHHDPADARSAGVRAGRQPRGPAPGVRAAQGVRHRTQGRAAATDGG
jgi:hypothetical protein